MGKKAGILFLFFILCGILTTGLYDQAFDDNLFSEKAQVLKDGYEDLDYSICKIKELLGGIHCFQTLGIVTSFYFHEILEKISFESSSFPLFFTYRAPPINS